MENPWTSLSQELIYNNNWISLTEHQVLNPNGGPGIYGVVHFKNLAIGIVAMEENGDIYLVGQFRFPINQYSWEIPEGGGKLEEDPLHSAQRELLEETGLRAEKWRVIQTMHLSNSVSDEYCILYMATDLRQGIAEPEETEKLEVKRIPFSEAYSMVVKGEITDSMSVTAILKVKILLDEAGGNPKNL